MKKIIFLIILAFLLYPLISSPLLAATRGIRVVSKHGQSLYLYKDYHALVVGVSNYEKWPRLPNAVNDAKEVASKLKGLCFKVKLVLDPTSREMKTFLNEMVYKMGTEENRALLFYYAGHGETEILADKTKMGYIIPRDCPLLKRDPLGFATHAISMRDIESASMRVHSKHVLMLFDCCFSGSLFALVRAVPDDITEKSALPVRQYITAGREDEQVPDKSMFKRCLLLGLEGDADLTGDGYITGSELGMYLSDKVVNYTHRRQHPQYGKINNPDLDRGDFIFALKGEPKEKEFAPVAPPEAPEPGGLEDYEAIIKKRKAKKKWAQWQLSMEENFTKAKSYDQSPELTPAEKAEAWASFLSSYRTDNPYSTKDEELREKAQKRRRHWKELKLAIVKKPAAPPRPPYVSTPPKSGELTDSDASVVKALIAALEDPELSKIAAEELAKINDPRAAEALITALKNNNLRIISGGYRFFIKEGIKGSEPTLIKALHSYGDISMAQSFFISGNSQLVSAARYWAKTHNCQIVPGLGSSGLDSSAPKWGQSQ